MAIERIKLRNIAGRSIDKVHCCYFDEENLQVIDVKALKITTGPSHKLVYVYGNRGVKIYSTILLVVNT